jgi:hypothetical protein
MSRPLIDRTARAMYRDDPGAKNKADFESLPLGEQMRYQRLAASAVSVVLREPVTEKELASPG